MMQKAFSSRQSASRSSSSSSRIFCPHPGPAALAAVLLLVWASMVHGASEVNQAKTLRLRRHVLEIESSDFQQAFFADTVRELKKSTHKQSKRSCDSGDYWDDIMCNMNFSFSYSMSMDMSMPTMGPPPSPPSAPMAPPPIAPVAPTPTSPSEPTLSPSPAAPSPSAPSAPTPSAPSEPTLSPSPVAPTPTTPTEPTLSPAPAAPTPTTPTEPTLSPAPAAPTPSEPTLTPSPFPFSSSGPDNTNSQVPSPPTAPSEPTVSLAPSASSGPFSPSVPTPTGGDGSSMEPTTTPFAICNSGPRELALVSIIQEISPISTVDPSTPQGQALQWITFDDPAQIDPCTYPDVAQRFAMATFYFATDGANWMSSENWLSAESECDWMGVTCSEDDGQVVEFALPQNNLAGMLPPEIRVFSEMEHFDVFFNSIMGPIPDVLGELTELTIFDVENNFLTGPAFVSNLPESLMSYRVSINELTGTVPDLSSLPALTELWFADNTMAGVLPTTIGANTNLRSLILYDTGLGGNLPTELGELDLEQFAAQRNNFDGPIPEELYSNTGLVELRLDRNSLTGTISTLLGDLVDLQDLRLGENEFSGTLPPQIAALMSLRTLIINATFLEGPVRDSFSTFENLRFVDFTRNAFTGPLPGSMFENGAIELFYLSMNVFTGAIPSNWGEADTLRDLYVNDNELTGMVPPIEPGQLENLSEFRLENNNIFGTMPASICALRGDDQETDLVTLIADCGGTNPLVQCDCCNGCVDNSN